MLRRRHINANPRGRFARPFLAVADSAKWPFERLAWLAERRLIWPLRERTAGWAPPAHTAGAAALALVAAGAVVVGILALSSNGGSDEQAATAARLAIATPQAQQKPATADEPQGPALQGVPPSFGVGEGVGVAEQAVDDAAGEAGRTSSVPPEDEEANDASGQGEAAAAATSSSSKPVPAGPAAMKVARRFAEAFVFYEVGAKPDRAKAVFGETATPGLAGALAERPPRLPEDAEVPKAKVVNLVPGPRRGKAYTVSVSLLRVGLTSELRLEMREQAGSWFVTDVRG